VLVYRDSHHVEPDEVTTTRLLESRFSVPPVSEY
jgi:hypothetical protein